MSSSKKSIRVQELETLGVLALFFLVLNVISPRPVFVYVALTLLIIGLFIKPLAAQISKGWLKFAEVLGTFNSKLILSLTFYLFLTPIALPVQGIHQKSADAEDGKRRIVLHGAQPHL